MNSALATDRRGVILLEYIQLQEPLPDSRELPPLSVVLIAASHHNRFLLVFNASRSCWEIPGGHIEPGETPADAARRELLEESGQTVDRLELKAVVKFRLPEKQQEIFGVVYSTFLSSVGAFNPTSEICQIAFWDGRSDLGYINELDAFLLLPFLHGQF